MLYQPQILEKAETILAPHKENLDFLSHCSAILRKNDNPVYSQFAGLILKNLIKDGNAETLLNNSKDI